MHTYKQTLPLCGRLRDYSVSSNSLFVAFIIDNIIDYYLLIAISKGYVSKKFFFRNIGTCTRKKGIEMMTKKINKLL
jgi:hypothetical protein